MPVLFSTDEMLTSTQFLNFNGKIEKRKRLTINTAANSSIFETNSYKERDFTLINYETLIKTVKNLSSAY